MFSIGYVFLLHIIQYGLTTQVHERGRLYEKQLLAFVLPFGRVGQARHRKGEPVLGCQSVKNHKASVVAGKGILRANVAQANDQEFHKNIQCKRATDWRYVMGVPSGNKQSSRYPYIPAGAAPTI